MLADTVVKSTNLLYYKGAQENFEPTRESSVLKMGHLVPIKSSVSGESQIKKKKKYKRNKLFEVIGYGKEVVFVGDI